MLDAEAAYVGSLLWLPAHQACAAAGWLTADDFADEQLAVIHGLVAQLAEAGVTPDPVATLAAARADGVIAGQEQAKRLSTALVRIYDHRATVPVNVRWYAASALADTLRRRVAEMGTRLVQAATTSSLEDLAALQEREAASVATLLRRHRELLAPAAGPRQRERAA